MSQTSIPNPENSQLPALTVYALNGMVPVVDPTSFVHPTAVLIGDVIVGPKCYIGPNASLRGDLVGSSSDQVSISKMGAVFMVAATRTLFLKKTPILATALSFMPVW